MSRLPLSKLPINPPRHFDRSKWAVVLIAAGLLSGCGLTPQGIFLRDTVATEGKAAAAQGLENAEWYICRASPVGAVVDRYGASEDQWASWSTLCRDRAPAASKPPTE